MSIAATRTQPILRWNTLYLAPNSGSPVPVAGHCGGGTPTAGGVEPDGAGTPNTGGTVGDAGNAGGGKAPGPGGPICLGMQTPP